MEQPSIEYEQLEQDLHEVCPWVKIKKEDWSNYYVEFGFSADNAFLVVLDLTLAEYDEMLNELLQIEVDAFNTSSGEMPDERDELYIRYERLGYLYDFFNNAKIKELK